MKTERKEIKRVESEQTIDILCNKCGHSCKNPHIDNYEGVIEKKVSGSFLARAELDENTLTFSWCEKCLEKLFDRCQIKPKIESEGYGGMHTKWLPKAERQKQEALESVLNEVYKVHEDSRDERRKILSDDGLKKIEKEKLVIENKKASEKKVIELKINAIKDIEGIENDPLYLELVKEKDEHK